ncbi:MAG: hypothetical protein E6Q88_03780 [Lysobacteraceae bacterium]|nr:MAG: hypothetical protein E6Q88_03780 [Xanthomonadaceae bacterium]
MRLLVWLYKKSAADAVVESSAVCWRVSRQKANIKAIGGEMKYSKTMLQMGALVTMVSASQIMYAAELRTVAKPIPNRYIVILKESVARKPGEKSGVPTVAEVGRLISYEHKIKVARTYEHVVRGFSVQMDNAGLTKLLSDPRVDYVQQDGYVYASTTQLGAVWGLDRIDQKSNRLDGKYNYDTTASNVHVYVIDSGMRSTHTEFSGRVGQGFTAINDGFGTEDCYGHGTHVTGTIGGTEYGVAKNVIIHPIRVFGCTGVGSTSLTLSGVDWVVRNRKLPAVVNMSLQSDGDNLLDRGVVNMVNAGVTVVVAAGNNGKNACGFSPAREGAAITVAATDRTDSRSVFAVASSNYGGCVDIFAPGSDIISAWPSSDIGAAILSGTSMASPHVAGVAALFLAKNPTATPAQVASAIVSAGTPGVVKMPGSGSPDLLLYTQVPPPKPPTPDVYGISKQGASGKTEVHVLDGSKNYQSFKLHVATILGQTGGDASWSFDLGDYNRDGVLDLYAIKKQGAGGKTEAHVLNGAGNFQSFLANIATAQPATGTDERWVFNVADYNRDGVLDLYAIDRQGASNYTEVHVLNGVGNFQSYLGHHVTALGNSGVDARWAFRLGDYNRDGYIDVYAIDKAGASGKTEVHVLDGASKYTSFLAHVATISAQVGANNLWAFDLGDYNRDDILDVVGVLKQGATGTTELHVMNGSNGFQSFLLHVGTAQHTTGSDKSWDFLMQP